MAPRGRDGARDPNGGRSRGIPRRPSCRSPAALLSNGLWVEVVELNPIVMRERTYKAAHRHPEPTLVECNEAKNVAHGRSRLLLIPRNEPFGGHYKVQGAEQTPVDEALQILLDHGGERPHVMGSEDVHLLGHDEMRRRE
jgi:hypothetical protein